MRILPKNEETSPAKKKDRNHKSRMNISTNWSTLPPSHVWNEWDFGNYGKMAELTSEVGQFLHVIQIGGASPIILVKFDRLNYALNYV
jgi:hypothetical protein